MKRLDFDTFCLMDDAITEHRYDWTFQEFREYRENVLGVTRETVIPYEYAVDLLPYRELEYNPDDFGMYGKFSEVKERITLAVAKEKNVVWGDYNAHRPGHRDLSYGRKAVEKKTGAGDWLVSYRNTTRDAIVKEYSRKQSTIHWQVDDENIDITCTWAQLLEYLGHYRSAKNGPERGAAYWFKSEPKKIGGDTDRWILEIQTYKTSSKKLAWILACPWQKK